MTFRWSMSEEEILLEMSSVDLVMMVVKLMIGERDYDGMMIDDDGDR